MARDETEAALARCGVAPFSLTHGGFLVVKCALQASVCAAVAVLLCATPPCQAAAPQSTIILHAQGPFRVLHPTMSYRMAANLVHKDKKGVVHEVPAGRELIWWIETAPKSGKFTKLGAMLTGPAGATFALKVPALTPGVYRIRVTFAGGPGYSGSSAEYLPIAILAVPVSWILQ